MVRIDPANILNYGAIGLGFLLAFLAYRLIAKEQKHESPRKTLLRAVYVFMLFSVTLTVMGFTSEYFERSDSSKKKLAEIRTVLRPMLDLKSGAIGQLSNDPSLSRDQVKSLCIIVKTLRRIDQKIAEAINIGSVSGHDSAGPNARLWDAGSSNCNRLMNQ